MKKNFAILAVAAAVAFTTSSCGTGLGGFTSPGGSSSTSIGTGKSQGSSSSSSSSTGSNLADLIFGFVGNLTQTSNLTVADLAGDWKYKAPAVNFMSENLLQKAGGAAAASYIEGKLADYYRMAGLTSATLQIDKTGKFTLQTGMISLSGTVSEAKSKEKTNFTFHFTALGLVSVGSMDAYVTKSGNTLNVMFDVSKLTEILKMAGSLTGNSTIQGVNSLLQSYDGICAGFKMTK